MSGIKVKVENFEDATKKSLGTLNAEIELDMAGNLTVTFRTFQGSFFSGRDVRKMQNAFSRAYRMDYKRVLQKAGVKKHAYKKEDEAVKPGNEIEEIGKGVTQNGENASGTVAGTDSNPDGTVESTGVTEPVTSTAVGGAERTSLSSSGKKSGKQPSWRKPRPDRSLGVSGEGLGGSNSDGLRLTADEGNFSVAGKSAGGGGDEDKGN